MEIRPATPDDLQSITEIYNHYIRETAITFDLHPFRAEDRRQWFTKFTLDGRHQILVAENDGNIEGYANSAQFRTKDAYLTSVETSIYLKHGLQRRGLGTTLYGALFQSLEGQDIHRAYGGVTLPNDASVALHTKFGFHKLGTMKEVGHKFGKYWDVAWYEKEL